MRVGVMLVLLAVGLLAAVGCAAESEAECPAGMQEVVWYEAFFGLDHADGRSVSPVEWDGFVADVITPRFPAGFSVLDVKGQVQMPDGVIERENSKLVMLAQPPPMEDGLELVDEISREYQQRFDQDPVFRAIAENRCVGLYGE